MAEATEERRAAPAWGALDIVTHPGLPLVLAWLTIIGLLGYEDPIVGLMVVLGFAGAFFSGLVGVGGAIIMVPLLLYVPPLLGLPPLGIKTVSAITIVQVTAASLAGLAGHLHGGLDRRLFLTLGLSMIGASFIGSLASAFVPAALIEGVFATMALVAAVLMLARRSRTPPETVGAPHFGALLAIAVGTVVGLLAGLVGAGGAFLLIPLMLYLLKIPMRVAVGTSLAIVAAAAVAGLLGRVFTGQIDWLLALGLVGGALPGGRLGSYVSRRTRVSWLATALGIVIALVAVRMWIDILT